MEYLYYLNKFRFTAGDTQEAFRFAKTLIEKDSNIDTLTFLVYQSQQYEPFLGELGIKQKDCVKHHIGTYKRIAIETHTVKTYNPSFAFQGRPECEILIAIGVPPKELNKFVDKSKVKYWILVPWLLEENSSFLSVHEAIDLRTGESLNVIKDIDYRVKGAVRWLMETSYPNRGYNHPSDNNRLREMSNALAYYNVPLDFDSVHHYCINNGMLDSSAIITAEHFIKAQERKFSTKTKINYKFLKEKMEEVD